MKTKTKTKATVTTTKAMTPTILLLGLATLATLAACAGKPPEPAWRADAFSALAAFSDAYLRGDSALADTEFARARRDLAATGRLDLVARAELVRCATRVASLEVDACPGFAALAQDADAGERAYAAYLAGSLPSRDVALLPEQHRAIAAGAAGKGGLAAIADPLARLVAAGVLFQAGRIGPDDIAAATGTASEQGWRRPLLMWLGVSLKRAQAAGEPAMAARIQRRIDLVLRP